MPRPPASEGTDGHFGCAGCVGAAGVGPVLTGVAAVGPGGAGATGVAATGVGGAAGAGVGGATGPAATAGTSCAVSLVVLTGNTAVGAATGGRLSGSSPSFRRRALSFSSNVARLGTGMFFRSLTRNRSRISSKIDISNQIRTSRKRMPPTEQIEFTGGCIRRCRRDDEITAD